MATKLFLVILSLVFGVSLIPGDVAGFEYPTREIECIVPFAPGSGADFAGRLVCKFAEKYVGKPIIVVNKPGGSGAIGFTMVASAKPDGYTMVILTSSIVTQPLLMKGVTYNMNSFRSMQIQRDPYGWVTKKGGPYDVPLKELVKMAKEKPNTIKFAISAVYSASDLCRMLLEEAAGVKFIVVPFASSDWQAPILGGHIDIATSSLGMFAPLYKAGKFSVFGVSSDERSPRFPEIPTFKELGYDVVMPNIQWIAAPAGTPDPIMNFLVEAFRKTIKEEAFKEALANAGYTAAWEGPEDSLETMKTMHQLTLRLIKKFDLKPQ